MIALFIIGAALGYALLGGVIPALVIGGFAASFPVAAARSREDARREAARDAWPRLLEAMRIQTGAVGRSIPQALFEVGKQSPPELRGAFDAAYREWLITTDFERTVSVLKTQLADPTADTVCETLLVAHQLGGADLDRRLSALVEDRVIDVHGRKDAQAKLAGARFARSFVLIVPFGMALAGASIGTGRASYDTPTAQLFVCIAIAIVIGCWVWAGRLMRMPEEHRVFPE
jgi:tight adherence protein B